MKKILTLLSIILLLSACSSSSDEGLDLNLINSTNNGDYSVLVPFVSSPVRAYHGTYLGKADFMEVGARLSEKAKSYFDPSQYYMSEGHVLDINELSQLVTRESSDNPYGLNPPSGSEFVTGVGDITVLNAVAIADVVEMDFYTGSASNPELAGLAFTIVLNDQLRTSDGSYTTVTQSRLYEYGSDMGRKLERFIRTLANMESIPVYIALYSTASIDNALPGYYIGDGYFDGRSGQFKENSEEWRLFPSTAAASADPALDASFSAFKGSIQDFVPENVGVIGHAHYVDNKLNSLDIFVHIQVKTYAEIYALTQYIATLLKEFDLASYDIIVKVENIDDTLAMIQKDRSGEITVILSD